MNRQPAEATGEAGSQTPPERRLAESRGGDLTILPLADWDLPMVMDMERVLMVDQALGRLDHLDPDLSRLVEMRVFAGLTLEEISELCQRSTSTLKREWRRAKAFLHRELTAA